MAKEARQIEQDLIENAKAQTGKSLEEWLDILGAQELDKSNALIKWLKQDYGLNHLQANIISSIYLNDGKPVHDYDVLFAKLFTKKNAQRPLYEKVKALIEANLPDDVLFIPTKTYVSIEADRVFGCVKINAKNIRLGLALGETPFDDTVVKAKGLGAMPHIGHMIEFTDEAAITDAIVPYMQNSYNIAHK